MKKLYYESLKNITRFTLNRENVRSIFLSPFLQSYSALSRAPHSGIRICTLGLLYASISIGNSFAHLTAFLNIYYILGTRNTKVNMTDTIPALTVFMV